VADRIVHLIDDDEDVRRALAFLLGTAGLAVKVYDSAIRFLEQQEGAQGCILSDVRMPGMDGLELMRKLSERGSQLPVIIMTGHGDVSLAVQAMKAGAVDFIEKPFSDDTLLNALEMAFSHQAGAGDNGTVRARIDTLSERERQVLNGLVVGHPNKTIAYDLGISPRTVEIHRANLMTKMGAASLSELVRMALIAGI
jgi:two-component system response regulator FixJ